MKKIIISMAMALLLLGSVSAQAAEQMDTEQAREIVQPLYDLLSGKDAEAAMRANYDKEWISFWGNGDKDYRELDTTIGFFKAASGEIIPDLNWDIQEVLVTTDGRIVVRGKGTGSPAGGNLFGAPAADGKSFSIMSIDIHTVESGKVVRTYHIEDWSRAIQQVAP